jgi:ribosome modulation factor
MLSAHIKGRSSTRLVPSRAVCPYQRPQFYQTRPVSCCLPISKATVLPDSSRLVLSAHIKGRSSTRLVPSRSVCPHQRPQFYQTRPVSCCLPISKAAVLPDSSRLVLSVHIKGRSSNRLVPSCAVCPCQRPQFCQTCLVLSAHIKGRSSTRLVASRAVCPYQMPQFYQTRPVLCCLPMSKAAVLPDLSRAVCPYQRPQFCQTSPVSIRRQFPFISVCLCLITASFFPKVEWLLKCGLWTMGRSD